MQFPRILAAVAALSLLPSALATSTLPLSVAERAKMADAICVGAIGSSISFRGQDGRIRTQTEVQVDLPLKGAFPPTLYLVHIGGALNGIEHRRSDLPTLNPNDSGVLFLNQREDGTVFVDDGPAGAILADGAFRNLLVDQIRALYPEPSAAGVDLQNSAAGSPLRQTAVVTDFRLVGGAPARFVHGDRNEPIGYLVDMDVLPTGIDANAALTALTNSFAAWAAVTSLSFEYRGTVSFGQAADAITNRDEMIRIQLHDTYNQVQGNNQLGVGGASALTDTGIGGTVSGDPFGRTVNGYVMIEHTEAALSDAVTFEEVLTHEIGHVLGLAHSSEDANESDATLNDAAMYFRIHGDGRGADLRAFDRTTVLQAYPTNNTPPVAFDRILYVVNHVTQDTNGPAPAVPGINEVEFGAFDLQPANLTAQLVASTSGSGTFSVDGLKVKYQSNGFFNGPAADPLDNLRYDSATVSISDGTNSSATVTLLIKALLLDRFPAAASDGIPDDWMTDFFGNADPAQVSGFSTAGDADGDGISNLDEFRIGTNPTNANSALMFLPATQNETVNFASTIGELYQIEVTTDFNNWVLAAFPVQATNTNTVVSNFIASIGDLGFFRLQRVP